MQGFMHFAPGVESKGFAAYAAVVELLKGMMDFVVIVEVGLVVEVLLTVDTGEKGLLQVVLVDVSCTM